MATTEENPSEDKERRGADQESSGRQPGALVFGHFAWGKH
jgi:hypothetical protein